MHEFSSPLGRWVSETPQSLHTLTGERAPVEISFAWTPAQRDFHEHTGPLTGGGGQTRNLQRLLRAVFHRSRSAIRSARLDP